MKRWTAWILAAVLLFALVPFAGAAFTDADAIGKTNRDAVDYISAKGVISGFPDGSFKPAETLTRAQAAKILCVMLEGADKANALTNKDTGFADVPASHWAARFVAYCAEKGIVAGVGNGSFNPDGTLTATAFSKMLLVAFGHAKAEELTGGEWLANTQKALRAKHFDWRTNTIGNDPTTRENACRLAYNVLLDAENAKIEPEAYKETTISFTDGKSYRLLGRASQAEDGVICDGSADGLEFKVVCKGNITLTANTEIAMNSCLRFRVIVDGDPGDQFALRTAGDRTDVAFASIPAGEHTVRIIRDSGVSRSRDVLKSVTLSCKPETVQPTAQKALYMQAIGDSGSAGFGVIPTDTPNVTTNSDSIILADPYLIAEALDMDYDFTVKGSQGFVRKAGKPTAYNYREVYEYRNRWRDPETKFDFPRKADLVTIQISANDQRYKKEEIRAGAKEMLQMVRAHNGSDVKIVLIVANNRYQHLLELGRELAAEDPNVYVVEYESIRDGMGKHSSANSHVIKSKAILEVVKPLFGKN